MNTHEVASALDLLLNMIIVMSEGGRPDRGDVQEVRDLIFRMKWPTEPHHPGDNP